jgi:hypothetical protein
MVQRGKQVVFVLLSVADLALTNWLLECSGGHVQEANPVAAWWLARHGAMGLACFKAAVVLLVLGLAAVIARHRPRAAGSILTFGCAALTFVVLYSAFLCKIAILSPEDRTRAEQDHARELIPVNREAHQMQLRRAAFLTLRQELCEGLIAGRCTLCQAVDRVAASQGERNPGLLSGLSIFCPDGSVAECIAAYLLYEVVKLQANTPEAAWRSVHRLEHELEIAYGRSLPRKHRELLSDSPLPLARTRNGAI